MYGDVSTDQRQRLGPRVGHVDGNIGDALARPEEGHRKGGELALVKEDQGAHGGQQHLEGRAAEHGKEARENEGKSMPRLMDDEVDTVEEPERAAARGEVEVALEDLPAKPRHYRQGEGHAKSGRLASGLGGGNGDRFGMAVSVDGAHGSRPLAMDREIADGGVVAAHRTLRISP